MWKEKKKACLQTKISTSDETAVTENPENSSANGNGLQSDLIFEEMGRRISEAGNQLVNKVNAVFQWDIMNGGKIVAQWTLDLKTGSGEVYRGASRKPANTMFILSDHDFMELALGKIKPQKAFLVGKVKVKGNILLSHKLEMLLKEYMKL
ncbi:SCP2 sterol-binding domain-containing protein 1 [Pogona vitticeps]|uniref:SCP2 sterol-binding domain-containing protein 1 n=1 Tax=Pogona vitticeps TaxID=103695 RepID=A0A6J0TCJ1_9SAUR